MKSLTPQMFLESNKYFSSELDIFSFYTEKNIWWVGNEMLKNISYFLMIKFQILK